jgi:streptogramin lyase
MSLAGQRPAGIKNISTNHQGRTAMPTRLILLTACASGALTLGLWSSAALAQGAAALSGQVTSTGEGSMEGVLVSAKKDGSTITTTVVSDDKGHFAFPADRLSPGHYAITIRAAGYTLVGPKDATVTAGQTATADIKLGKAKNIFNTLSNAELMISAPGSDQQKRFLTNCTSCHTLQRVFSASHTPEEFEQVFKRMGTYSPGSTPTHPQPLVPGPRGLRPRVPAAQAPAAAKWLYSVNLSNPDRKEYDFKTLPRPKGKATHVIITQYDLPRKEAQPHDVVVDQDGMVWYSDFGNQFTGVLDPKTGKATEIPIPVFKPEQPKGSLDIELDPQGNLWLAMMYQAGIVKVDRKTHQVSTYPFPKEWQSASAQASMVSPQHSDADGKVWTNNQEHHDVYRLDVKTGKYENVGPSKDPSGKQIAAYGMPTDAHNNLYQLQFSGAAIGLRDAKTLQTTIYQTPTARSKPRRGRVDANGHLWFAEYGSNSIGFFDPKTAAIKEYKLPTPWSDPYDVVASKDGTQVWTGSMQTDQVSRLDVKTGTVTDYLLPKSTNIRRVFLQETGPRPILWVGSNHGGSIVRVEPLD